MEPIDETGWSSKTGFQRTPRSPPSHPPPPPGGGAGEPVLEGGELLGAALGPLVLVRAKGARPGVDPPDEKARHDGHESPVMHPLSPNPRQSREHTRWPPVRPRLRVSRRLDRPPAGG